jgi:hypothetical protein
MKRIREIDKYKQDIVSIDVQSILTGEGKGVFSQYRRGNEFLINSEGDIEVDREVKDEFVKKGQKKLRIYKEILYNPLSEKTLLQDFIKIKNEKDIVDYSNRYGSLSGQMILNSDILNQKNDKSVFDNVKLSDAVAILYHAKVLRALTSGFGLFKEICMMIEEGKRCYESGQRELFLSLKKHKGDMVSTRHFDINENCLDCYYINEFKSITEVFKLSNVSHKYAYSLPSLYNYDLLTYSSKGAMNVNFNYIVLEAVQRCINNNTKNIKYRFNYDEKGILKPSMLCSCLLEYIWFAFGMSLSGKIKRCKTCGNWFVSNREDAEYCPPIYKRKYSKCHPSYIKKLKNND